MIWARFRSFLFFFSLSQENGLDRCRTGHTLKTGLEAFVSSSLKLARVGGRKSQPRQAQDGSRFVSKFEQRKWSRTAPVTVRTAGFLSLLSPLSGCLHLTYYLPLATRLRTARPKRDGAADSTRNERAPPSHPHRWDDSTQDLEPYKRKQGEINRKDQRGPSCMRTHRPILCFPHSPSRRIETRVKNEGGPV